MWYNSPKTSWYLWMNNSLYFWKIFYFEKKKKKTFTLTFIQSVRKGCLFIFILMVTAQKHFLKMSYNFFNTNRYTSGNYVDLHIYIDSIFFIQFLEHQMQRLSHMHPHTENTSSATALKWHIARCSWTYLASLFPYFHTASRSSECYTESQRAADESLISISVVSGVIKRTLTVNIALQINTSVA